MKGLIKKDLLNLSSYKTTLLIVIIFCSFGIVGTESITMAPIVICTIIGMISLSTFNYDESSKSDKFILSLPITKKRNSPIQIYTSHIINYYRWPTRYYSYHFNSKHSKYNTPK